MKKLFLLTIMVLLSITSNAQLVLDSLGKMELMPYQVPNNQVIPASGYSATFRPIGTGGLLIEKLDTDNHGSYRGIDVYLNGFGASVAGISSESKGSGLLYNCGLRGVAQSSSHSQTICLGVYGGLKEPIINGAGVYGTTTSVPSLMYTPDDIYAGYFVGDICVTGSINGILLSPTSSYDRSSEEGTSILSENDKSNVTERLQSVDVLQMHRVNNNGSLAANKEQKIRNMPEIDRSSLTDKQLQELEEIEEAAKKEPKQTKFSAVSYGLAADQLKEVYPELVYEDAEGNYSINYIEMVPLLVQSIKELSSEIARLKGEDAELTKKAKSTVSNIEDTKTEVDMVRMDQNKPNPFIGSTVINLNIPEKIQTARIFIYDLNGKEVKNILVNERGITNITIYARDLTAGMYIYCLVVDGKQCVTRRMIVSKI